MGSLIAGRQTTSSQILALSSSLPTLPIATYLGKRLKKGPVYEVMRLKALVLAMRLKAMAPAMI
jgi:hypothetical protein